MEKTFAGGGVGDFELEAQYWSGDLAVLVGVERQSGPIGGLPISMLHHSVLARGFADSE